MKVRLIVWALVLAISAGFAIIPGKLKERSAKKEAEYAQRQEIVISSDLDIEYYVKKFFKSDNLKKNYRYSIIKKPTQGKEVDVFLTTDGKQVSEENYSVLGYTPMVVLIGNSNHDKFEQYAKNKLISFTDEKKLKFDENDKLTIDFSKIVDAILTGKDWSTFGGDNVPLKVYCPLADTVDGELFNKFLLVTLNGGIYPDENKIQELQGKVDLFLKSPCVERINMNQRLDNFYITENELYCTFESDIIDSDKFSSSSIDYAVTYPNKTIIRQIYFQVAADKKSLLGELPYHITWSSNSLEYNIRHSLYYRTVAEPNSVFEDEHISMTRYRNIKDNFSYVHVPVN